MRAENFDRILHMLWDGPHGLRWDLASDALGAGTRTLQRFASGKNEIPDWVPIRVREIVEEHCAELIGLLDPPSTG